MVAKTIYKKKELIDIDRLTDELEALLQKRIDYLNKLLKELK